MSHDEAKRLLRIVVLAGGTSSERDVSLESGANVNHLASRTWASSDADRSSRRGTGEFATGHRHHSANASRNWRRGRSPATASEPDWSSVAGKFGRSIATDI